MLATAVIVFREVMEAALIISLVMAATTGLAGRNFWVATGLAGGVIGAGVVALFADTISHLPSLMGQEVFNATILFAAVAKLAWHCIWMSRHGRELANAAGSVSRDVREAGFEMFASATVI